MTYGARLLKGISQCAYSCLLLTVVLLLPSSQAFGAPLKLEVGQVSYISDRADSTLLRAAHEIYLEERNEYRDTYNLDIQAPLTIYFYYDRDLATPRVHSAPYWSGGIASAGSEIHIFGHRRAQWLSTLRHELFHILIRQNDINIPVWLNEGLAQWHSGHSDWGKFMELGTATARGDLIPLVDMDVILSFNHKRAGLAYGQALDATRFLIKHQGISILPHLLKSGEIGFRERYIREAGESIIDFEIAWRKDLERRFWFFKISQIPGMLWAISPLIVILAWFLKYRRGKQKMQEWELEEQRPLDRDQWN